MWIYSDELVNTASIVEVMCKCGCGVSMQQFRDGMGLSWGCAFPLVSLLFRDVCVAIPKCVLNFPIFTLLVSFLF